MNLTAIQGNIVSMRGNLLAMDARKPFIIKVDTSKGNGFPSFKIPTRAGYAYNFGYRINETGGWAYITSHNQAETLINFPSGGIYTIEVRGSVGSWYDNNTGDVQKYTELVSFGDVVFGQLDGMFYGAINLKFAGSVSNQLVVNGPNAPFATTALRFCSSSGVNYLPVNILSRTPSLTIASNFFALCASLQGIIPANILRYVPKLTSAPYFLQDCFYLTGSIPTDLLRYVPLVDNLNGFLYRCVRLTGVLPPEFLWYVPKVTNISALLYNCDGIVSVLSGDEFKNLTKVTSAARCMQGMFRLTGRVPSLYDMPLLTDGSYFMADCRNLTVDGNPSGLFNLSTINKITNLTSCLSVTNTAYSHTGTLQPIWDYVLESAAGKSTAFLNNTAITNYPQLRANWP